MGRLLYDVASDVVVFLVLAWIFASCIVFCFVGVSREENHNLLDADMIAFLEIPCCRVASSGSYSTPQSSTRRGCPYSSGTLHETGLQIPTQRHLTRSGSHDRSGYASSSHQCIYRMSSLLDFLIQRSSSQLIQ